jgi:NAD(P)-dependent dehydrogenase (short-subunit alcohol dehydrogenase family)
VAEDFTLPDKAALITGGKRIGAVVATELAKHGVDVALSYNRSRDQAERTAEAVRALGRTCVLVQADLSNASDCGRLVTTAASELGRLDILINMASVYAAVPFDATDEARWDAVIDVDLKAAFLCSRAAVPYMRTAGEGRIINFSDWIAASGRPRYPGYLPYYVAKRGVIGLTEALALELAPDRILVNAIAPGPIIAPEGTATDELEAVEKATPLAHWGGEEVIAAAALFLLESTFITGETIRVDGGRHVR